MLIQKFREINNDLRICFIDYSKAFDCVNHQMMWKTLSDMNFHPKIIALLKSLYSNQQAVVRLENTTTETFTVGKGVRQGCILSPYLFNLYTEDIMRDVELDDRSTRYDEVNIHGHRIRDLRYADDTALLSTTTIGLTNLIMSVKEHSEKKGLLLNVKKTKIMDTDKCIEKTEIAINGEQVENVNHYEYLGARLQGDGKTSSEIRRRIAIATQKLNNLKNVWKGQNIPTKIRI